MISTNCNFRCLRSTESPKSKRRPLPRLTDTTSLCFTAFIRPTLKFFRPKYALACFDVNLVKKLQINNINEIPVSLFLGIQWFRDRQTYPPVKRFFLLRMQNALVNNRKVFECAQVAVFYTFFLLFLLLQFFALP